MSVKENTDKVADTLSKVHKKVTDEQAKVSDRVTDKREMIVEKAVAKALENGDKLTQNRITILLLMTENPYITKMELASAVGISATSIMRNKYLRRVGPDNGGFWEIIE